ncbi:MAG: hypothetical protein E2O39_03405 [Planctomycetota bacterium]|nr:MAG: hypothetical protein E2O39_03405 [Planctomycetota bacterium]
MTARLVQRLIERQQEDFEPAIDPVEAHGYRHASSRLDGHSRSPRLFERHLRDDPSRERSAGPTPRGRRRAR